MSGAAADRRGALAVGESGTRQTAPARSFIPSSSSLTVTLLVVAVVVTAVGYAVTRPAHNDREAQFRAGRRHDRCAVRTGREPRVAQTIRCLKRLIDLTSTGLR